MDDSSAVAHPGAGDDYFRRSDLVYFLGFFRFHSENKPGKIKQVVPF